jgi:uncharacterized membrane protein YfcA
MEIFLYLCGGVLAGICNATAGGGTLITFPLFIANGINPLIANASNAVAVYPAHALATYGYRKVLIENKLLKLKWIALSLAGAVFGAFLLTIIDGQTFNKLVPVLIALATILFAFGNQLRTCLQGISTSSKRCVWFGDALLVFFAIYGGFFGAGLGVMLMAGLLMMGIGDIQNNNALKNGLAAIITSVSVVIFIFAGLVDWNIVLPTLGGAIIGGLIGANIAQRLNVTALKSIVIMTGIVLTFYYSYKIYE